MNKGRIGICFFALLIGAGIPSGAAAAPASCSRLTIQGEVAAGKEWSAPIGNGWVFRVVPVQPAGKYTGWDLVVDRAGQAGGPAGFPDSLYLATPPYGSLNEREIATTYALRAQDAIGWNPRSFHFLTNPAAFKTAQQVYLAGRFASRGASDPQTAGRLLDLISTASSGEFRILNARLTPGTADPAPYAQSWALAASHTPYDVVPAAPGTSTPRGTLLWMRFSITLQPPAGWSHPAGWTAIPVACLASTAYR